MLTSQETINAFSRELEGIVKQGVDVTLPMIMGGLGAGAGGLAGYKTTKNPSKKLRNALIAALLTGPAAFGLTKMIQGAGGGKAPAEGGASIGPPMESGPKPTPVEETLQMSLPDKTLQGLGQIQGPRSMAPPTPYEQAARSSFPEATLQALSQR